LNHTSTKYIQTLITEKGKRIAAPDLSQKKQMALIAALLNCRLFYFVSPLLSKIIENGIMQKVDSPDEFERGVKNIHDGLSSIYQ